MNESRLRSLLQKLSIVPLTRYNQWLMAQCPFAKWTHPKGSDSKPSFGIAVNDEGYSGYHCFTCKMQGRLSYLVQELTKYTGKSYGDLWVKVELAEVSNGLETYEDMAVICDESVDAALPVSEDFYTSRYSPITEHDAAVAYLNNRNVSTDTAIKLGLLFDNDDKEKRILFPVRDDKGNFYGYTGRSILEPKDYPILPNGKDYPKIKDYAGLPKKYLLLGSEFFNPKLPVFVVEGLFGYASLHNQGVSSIANVVATMGSEMTDQKATQLLEWDRAVYLMFDNDAAGEVGLFGRFDGKNQKSKGAIDKLISHVPLFVPSWDSGKKDPDELSFGDVKRILDNCPLFSY